MEVTVNEISNRQKEIIEQAISLIAEKGIQNLTIKNLAKRMGFSEPAVYRHFQSKNEILLAIIGIFGEKSKQSLEKNQLKVNSFTENISHLLTSHVELLMQNPTYATVIFSEELFLNEIELVNKMKEMMMRRETYISEIIEIAQAKSEVRDDIDKQSLALIIMGGMRLLVKKWALSGFQSDLNKNIETYIESIIKITGKGE